jgi:hypothetical protein
VTRRNAAAKDSAWATEKEGLLAAMPPHAEELLLVDAYSVLEVD